MAGSDNTPPKKGPIMKPKPNAAPSMPILPATWSSSLISPMYALATAMFPFPAPARNRAIMAMARLPDRPKTMKKREFAARPNIRTGLLPMRSEIDPRIGVEMNWARE